MLHSDDKNEREILYLGAKGEYGNEILENSKPEYSQG